MLDDKIISRQTVSGMVGAYKQACDEIDRGYALLWQAQQRLVAAFSDKYSTFTVINDHHHRLEGEEARIAKLRIRKAAWRQVISLLEIHKVMTAKAWDDMIEKLNSDSVPELTEEEVFSTLETLRQNAREYAKAAIIETYNFLMRGQDDWNRHKTNTKNARRSLGEKIIIPGILEHDYGEGMRVKSYYDNDVVGIDKVFSALDGCGIPDGYKSPLVDAINTSKGAMGGSTTYFSFRCHHNGNLHLVFKRMDLVDLLNRKAGYSGKLPD
jgi:hypothetical protein